MVTTSRLDIVKITGLGAMALGVGVIMQQATRNRLPKLHFGRSISYEDDYDSCLD
jgi:hypothetical protein